MLTSEIILAVLQLNVKVYLWLQSILCYKKIAKGKYVEGKTFIIVFKRARTNLFMEYSNSSVWIKTLFFTKHLRVLSFFYQKTNNLIMLRYLSIYSQRDTTILITNLLRMKPDKKSIKLRFDSGKAQAGLKLPLIVNNTCANMTIAHIRIMITSRYQ